MPHIYPHSIDGQCFTAPDDGGPTINGFLAENKVAIAQAFSDASGYPAGKIAVIPHIVAAEHRDMSHNMLPLEFVILAGSKCIGRCKEVAKDFKTRVLKLRNADRIHFGVWLHAGGENYYIEYDPAAPDKDEGD